MDKYLLEILKIVNTIIIPGLGALTITDSETGEIMFMSYLKHDDGKLSNHIAEKEGWEENDAKNLISKYVREILSDLDKGEEYSMFQFGTFYKEEDEIFFRNWDKKSTPVFEPKTEDVKEETKIVPIITPEKELNILEKEAKAETIEKLNKLKKEKEESEKKKKKGAGFYVGIGLLVLLIGGGIYTIINYDHLKTKLPFLAETKTTESEVPTEEIVEEEEEVPDETSAENNNSTIEEEPIIEEEEVETQEENEIIPETPAVEPEDNTSKPYNIIAGAFSSEENAIKLVEKLKTLGHSASYKKKNGMHVVSAQSYATKSEARSALSTIKNDVPNGWISKW